MLPSTSPREALLACPPSPPWNLPSFTVESTFSSPHSCSDPLSPAKVPVSLTLTLSHFTIWCFRLTTQFLFLLAKVALADLPTALSVALKPLIPFQQAQHAQVFLLKPVPFCKLFAGLCSTNKSVTSLLLLSDSRSVLSSIFSFTSISLADLAGTVFSLLSYFSYPLFSFLGMEVYCLI